jgi:hypothetical protein
MPAHIRPKEEIMKSFMTLALAGMVMLGMSAAAFAEDPAAGSDAKGQTKATLAPAEIKGEVLKVDGETFVVKDERSKSEVKFMIEKDVTASLERPLKEGDRIEVSLTPEGYAKTIRFEGAKDQSKSPEGSNPTLSPGGKGSAGGG